MLLVGDDYRDDSDWWYQLMIMTVGDVVYRAHIFTSSGTFDVTALGANSLLVTLLIML